MRVLFTMSPGYGHMLPLVSTAWALRAAGHEVLLALAGRTEEEVPALVAAGLQVVQVASPEQIGAAFESLQQDERYKGKDRAQMMAERRAQAKAADPTDTFANQLFGPISDAMVDNTVELALSWRPDLVVHSPLQGVGPLVAAKLGVPTVEHAFGLASVKSGALALAEALAPAYRRHGVEGFPQRYELLNVAPPSMRIGDPGWQVRHVPFHGGAVLPDWLLHKPERPRIVVTLGTVLPTWVGLGPLQWVADVAAQVDAEFVLALGTADPAALGELPANVRPIGWVPLSALLATSAAAIHHGGSGSTMASLAAGVPQILVPQGADQFFNSRAVAKRGVGLEIDTDIAPVTAEDVRRVLTDESIHSAVAQVKAEIAGMPSPADVVARLEGLVG
ncbi:UDP:flavonoid glycosyltransferase YjiC (YdhE family) [Kutzneria viridogrisea]|uniref:UDP:flavonoid glycosyltransferase YjiC (YdhE family) n=1 Tax=Kutzneria viridogrisea TaxID=47990 RepID=A0ABR6BHT0_9PSEU|nr:UDP:flavonoid glycosyltransferase YjiC (YdhE family) [Kutzneria viridogrisea]